MDLQNYRRDYPGEFVVTATKFENGKKTQIREWVPNPIINHHISGRAAVIGSNVDLEVFDYRVLQRHRGGLLGALRLQTYGANEIWQDMPLDFYASYNKFELAEIVKTDYPENTVVYTNSRSIFQYPDRFYLVPYQPLISSLALPLYLAAFDGHQEVFLLGYNKETTQPSSTNWAKDVNRIFESFRSTKFWLVGHEANMYDFWRHNRNVDCMLPKKFITYCDI